jgi:hypothetical protein
MPANGVKIFCIRIVSSRCLFGSRGEPFSRAGCLYSRFGRSALLLLLLSSAATGRVGNTIIVEGSLTEHPNLGKSAGRSATWRAAVAPEPEGAAVTRRIGRFDLQEE